MTISVICTFAAVVCGIVWFHCLGDWSQCKMTAPAFWANIGRSFGSNAEIWKPSREKDYLIVAVQAVIVCVCTIVFFVKINYLPEKEATAWRVCLYNSFVGLFLSNCFCNAYTYVYLKEPIWPPTLENLGPYINFFYRYYVVAFCACCVYVWCFYKKRAEALLREEEEVAERQRPNKRRNNKNNNKNKGKGKGKRK